MKQRKFIVKPHSPPLTPSKPVPPKDAAGALSAVDEVRMEKLRLENPEYTIWGSPSFQIYHPGKSQSSAEWEAGNLRYVAAEKLAARENREISPDEFRSAGMSGQAASLERRDAEDEARRKKEREDAEDK